MDICFTHAETRIGTDFTACGGVDSNKALCYQPPPIWARKGFKCPFFYRGFKGLRALEGRGLVARRGFLVPCNVGSNPAAPTLRPETDYVRSDLYRQ